MWPPPPSGELGAALDTRHLGRVGRFRFLTHRSHSFRFNLLVIWFLRVKASMVDLRPFCKNRFTEQINICDKARPLHGQPALGPPPRQRGRAHPCCDPSGVLSIRGQLGRVQASAESSGAAVPCGRVGRVRAHGRAGSRWPAGCPGLPQAGPPLPLQASLRLPRGFGETNFCEGSLH